MLWQTVQSWTLRVLRQQLEHPASALLSVLSDLEVKSPNGG